MFCHYISDEEKGGVVSVQDYRNGAEKGDPQLRIIVPAKPVVALGRPPCASTSRL